MKKYLYRGGFFVLCTAITLHGLWAVILFAANHELRTTPMSYLIGAFGQKVSAVILVVGAVLAFYGIRHPGWKGLAFSLPQNLLLFVAASSGIVSALYGRYPDGVVRSSAFILTDQLPMILMAFLHAASLAVYHGQNFSLTEDQWTTPRS